MEAEIQAPELPVKQMDSYNLANIPKFKTTVKDQIADWSNLGAICKMIFAF